MSEDGEVTGYAQYGIVHLVGMVGHGMGEDVESPSRYHVIEDLMDAHELCPKDLPIRLIVSSEGGDVHLGMAIQSTIHDIRRAGRKVIGHVAGQAYSAAFDIIQACDWRTCEPYAGLMIHGQQKGSEDSSGNMIDTGRFNKALDKAQYTLLSQRTGRPVEFYQKKTDNKSWYLTAPEALAEGFVDEILAIVPFEITAKPKARRKRRVTAASAVDAMVAALG
jgi:ATP-dependent protease ClpP protease subunit